MPRRRRRLAEGLGARRATRLPPSVSCHANIVFPPRAVLAIPPSSSSPKQCLPHSHVAPPNIGGHRNWFCRSFGSLRFFKLPI